LGCRDSRFFGLGEEANPSHYVGLSFDYITDDCRYATIYQHDEDYLMFLFRYKWYTPDIASGRIQPYLGFGAGNTIVNYKERPETPPFSDGKDNINPTFCLDAGGDLAFSSWFALNLRYSAIGVFDIKRFRGTTVTENDILHGFRLGARISW
jgi:opacity protein-like surface antigen